MPDLERTFSVASEDVLVRLIENAQQRLVVIAPALSDGVAKALEARLDEGSVTATVILDADPEVYRLGYGSEVALDRIRGASSRNQLDLRIQVGVRIGVIISDNVTMVFSPVPLLIEAGSTSIEKPNAIMLSGHVVEQLAGAAGAGVGEAFQEQEIGTNALTPETATALKAALKSNPPQRFDVSRALRVFNSKVQYVEIQVENYRFSSRQVRVPEELLNIHDPDLGKQLLTRLRAPVGPLASIEITIVALDGKTKQDKIDERWIARERKRIEDEYTYPVPRYGRVIFTRDRARFDKEIESFRGVLEKYCAEVRKHFQSVKVEFKERLINEFLPKWVVKPPPHFERHGVHPTEEILRQELTQIVEKLAVEAISFEAPQIRVVYKSISSESVHEPTFVNPLLKMMRRRHVPMTIIDSLFLTHDAAPSADES
jgi:hypothetical protein